MKIIYISHDTDKNIERPTTPHAKLIEVGYHYHLIYVKYTVRSYSVHLQLNDLNVRMKAILHPVYQSCNY